MFLSDLEEAFENAAVEKAGRAERPTVVCGPRFHGERWPRHMVSGLFLHLRVYWKSVSTAPDLDF